MLKSTLFSFQNNIEEPSVKKKFNKNDSSMNLKIIPIKVRIEISFIACKLSVFIFNINLFVYCSI